MIARYWPQWMPFLPALTLLSLVAAGPVWAQTEQTTLAPLSARQAVLTPLAGTQQTTTQQTTAAPTSARTATPAPAQANEPPTVVAAPIAPINVGSGEPFAFSVSFAPPEAGQGFSSTGTDLIGGITFADVSCNTTFGPPGGITTVDCSGAVTTAGAYQFVITATDDGSPPLSNAATVDLLIAPDVCDLPTIGAEVVDGAAKTVTVPFFANDPSGLVEIFFSQLDGFTVTSAPGFTETGPDTWTPTGAPPATATFVLTATASTASYYAVVTNGCGSVFDADPVHSGFDIPSAFVLERNYPNPFNPETTIRFTLPEAAPVMLTVYDVAGRHVRTLAKGALETGTHTVSWDGRDEAGSSVASGLYLYRLEAATFSQSRTMLLLK